MDTLVIFLEHPLLQYPAMVWGCVFLTKRTLALLDLDIKQCLHQTAIGFKKLGQWFDKKLTLPKSHSNPRAQKACLYLMVTIDYLFAWYFLVHAVVTWADTLISHPDLPFLNQMGILAVVVVMFIAARFFRIEAINGEIKAKQL
jgi:hypothetical protein